jgi:hypothetical protein
MNRIIVRTKDINFNSLYLYAVAADLPKMKIDKISVREAFIPRLADNSGWASAGVVTEYLAGNWHNQAETFVRFPASATALDKSDVALWPATVRARDEYDAGNPRDWAGWELGAYNLTVDGAGLGNENEIFSASSDNEYVYLDGQPQIDPVAGTPFVFDESPLTKVSHLLVYSVAKTKAQMIQILNYIKSFVGI